MRTILLAASILSFHATEALAASIESPIIPQPLQLSTRQFDAPMPADIVTVQQRVSSVPGYEQRSANDNHRQHFTRLNFGL